MALAHQGSLGAAATWRPAVLHPSRCQFYAAAQLAVASRASHPTCHPGHHAALSGTITSCRRTSLHIAHAASVREQGLDVRGTSRLELSLAHAAKAASDLQVANVGEAGPFRSVLCANRGVTGLIAHDSALTEHDGVTWENSVTCACSCLFSRPACPYQSHFMSYALDVLANLLSVSNASGSVACVFCHFVVGSGSELLAWACVP